MTDFFVHFNGCQIKYLLMLCFVSLLSTLGQVSTILFPHAPLEFSIFNILVHISNIGVSIIQYHHSHMRGKWEKVQLLFFVNATRSCCCGVSSHFSQAQWTIWHWEVLSEARACLGFWFFFLLKRLGDSLTLVSNSLCRPCTGVIL